MQKTLKVAFSVEFVETMSYFNYFCLICLLQIIYLFIVNFANKDLQLVMQRTKESKYKPIV